VLDRPQILPDLPLVLGEFLLKTVFDCFNVSPLFLGKE